MKKDLNALAHLVRRGVKIFLSDKMSVFLSLLAPLIILFLYLMFLGDIQYDSVKSALEGIEVRDEAVHAFIDGWMLAGVLATSCITVSFCAQTVMIADRERGAVQDMLTSPVKRGVLSVSYLVVNFIITLVLTTAVAIVALIYLAASGWYLNGTDIGKLIGILLLSVLSASLFSTIVSMFIRTQSAHGGASGILSAAIGFFIGAYMPMAMFPKAIQYIVLFIPGTYSAGIFRNIFMRGSLNGIMQSIPTPVAAEVKSQLMDSFSMNMDAFGNTIGEATMWAAFAVTIAIFILLYILNQIVRTKTNTLFSAPSPWRVKRFRKAEEDKK